MTGSSVIHQAKYEMRYHEIIEAVASADLFHFARVDHVAPILQSNQLKGPVSLTRDTNHFITYLSKSNAHNDLVLFVIDGNKLRNRYKLAQRFGDIREPHSVGIMLFDPSPEAVAHGREAEEQTTKSISPLSAYLKEIVVNTQIRSVAEWPQIESLLRNYASKFGVKISFGSFDYRSAWFRKRQPA